MEHIWVRVVRKEYNRDRILEESNLHSKTYFHLRKVKGNSTLFFELNSNMNRRLGPQCKRGETALKGVFLVPEVGIEPTRGGSPAGF
jgi:hypothetical protein